MSEYRDSIDAPTRSQRLVTDVLDRLSERGELVSGAAAELAPIASQGHGTPGKTLAALWTVLEGPRGQVYFAPEYERPTGQGTLRRVLDALPIRRDTAERFARQHALEANKLIDPRPRVESGFPEDEARAAALASLVEWVVDRLDAPEYRHAWLGSFRPEVPLTERVLLETLHALPEVQHRLRPTLEAAAIKRLSAGLVGLTVGMRNRLVLQRLMDEYYSTGILSYNAPLGVRDIDLSAPHVQDHYSGGEISTANAEALRESIGSYF